MIPLIPRNELIQMKENKHQKSFQLTDGFVDKYRRKRPPFGFNGLGELVYMRTYSRLKPDGRNEQWWETVRRVVEGTYNMQKRHIEEHSLGWNAWKAQNSAQEMFDRIFNMKFLNVGLAGWNFDSPAPLRRSISTGHTSFERYFLYFWS